MARRQTNRDGLRIRHELTSADDSDTAHREVLRRMETYGKDPDASNYEVAKDTVLLLRALNDRFRHFKAQILADIKMRECNQTLRPQPQSDTPPEARNRRYTLPSTTPPMGIRSPEHTHAIDADEGRGSSPIWRPTRTKEVQPQIKSSTLGTTAPDEPRPQDADKSNLCLVTHICQETKFLDLLDKPTDDNPVDPKPQVNEIIANQRQLRTPEHATVNSDDNRYTPATPDYTGFAQDINVTKLKHTITEENTKTEASTMNKYMTTVGDTAAYREYSPSTQTEPLPRQDHEARPPRRPGDGNTPDLKTAVTTKHTPRREHTIARPYTTKTGEEPHTYRDVNLIPDRGKKPNETFIAKTKHEEPPPKLNNFCMYK